MLNNAKKIIQLFGGINPLATAIGKDPTTIYRWTYPKEKGGTGGTIPASSMKKVLLAAKQQGLSLEDKEKSNPHDFVQWFRNTAPYIHAHRGKTFVISVNGEAIQSDNFASMIQDFALLNSLGIRLIIVHGIRAQLEEKLKTCQQPSQVFHYLRATNKQTLELAKEASGIIRINIEAQLSTALANTSMKTANIQVVSGNFITAKPLGIIDGVDYQFTGEVRRVNSDSLTKKLDDGCIVLVSPLAYSPTGDVFNLRCEEIATAIATTIQSDKLIILTKQTELLNAQKNLVRQLTTHQAKVLLKTVDDSSSDTFLHLQEAIQASEKGVKRIHLIDQRIDGGIQLELFTRQGSGTLISAQPFEDARAASIDDIQGIIELIRPLEARGLLTPRTAESIEIDISKFHVIEQDGLITTCAALYQYPTEAIGELACVAVHPQYRTGERGNYLLSMIEQQALSSGIHKLFVLTTQSSHWFIERGFEPSTLDQLPKEKQLNYNQTRRSTILVKKLINTPIGI